MPHADAEEPEPPAARAGDDVAEAAGPKDTWSPAAASHAGDPYAAFRFPDFRRFLLGHFCSSIGTQMQTVAVGWYLYERTDSALALGGVGLAQVLPMFLLTLPAGHLADRIDRRKLLVGALALGALNSLGLAWVSAVHGAIALLYLFLVLNGVARAFIAPARDALGPQLLPIELLGNGATWRSGGFQLAAVIGPSAGGLVIGLTHAATPAFIGTAVMLGAFGALVANVTPRRYVPARGGRPLEALAGGVRFILRTRILLATITLDLFAVLLGGATMLLPIFAKDILHVGPSGLGWMMAAPSLGAVLVALPLARRPLERAGPALLWAVGGFGVATIAFGLSRSFALSLALLAAIGGLDMVSVVIRSTLMQVLTPDELRGRVGAINALFVGTSNELGGFESGTTAALFGPVASVVAGGIGSLLVVLLVAKLWPEVGRYGRLESA